MKIEELLEEFKLDIEINNYSKETVYRYGNLLKIFNAYLTEVLSVTDVEKIKAVHMKAFVKFNK
ncbi:MAG: hypothetical protein SPD90_05440, partial [Intestinibacter sp.]|uniref:hypothetical protein n=1 Tax=Intestinibacter sp. TaxID=1965304 RepID=UPI002A9014DC|nr:hypothetical protein [Intestinibacter sp.]